MAQATAPSRGAPSLLSQICPLAIVHCSSKNAVVVAKRAIACRRNWNERGKTNDNWRSMRFVRRRRRRRQFPTLTGTKRRDAHRASAPRRPAGSSSSRRFHRRRRPARGGDGRVPGERGERRRHLFSRSIKRQNSKEKKRKKCFSLSLC